MAIELPPYRPQLAQCGAVALGTPQLEVSLSFFRDTLGMEEVERVGDTVYLRGYQELKHHSLVLFQSDTATVDSYSFRVSRPEDVELFYNQLLAEEVEVVELLRRSARRAHVRAVLRHRCPGGSRGNPVEAAEQLLTPSRARRAPARSLQHPGRLRQHRQG